MTEITTIPVQTPNEDEALQDEEARRQHLEQIHIAVASIDEVRATARDAADARIAEETQAGGGFRGFMRKIWKGNLAQTYYQKKYQHQAEQEIVETGDLYAFHDDTAQTTEGTKQSVITRLTHGHVQELLSGEAGERLERLNNPEDERQQEIRSTITGLIEAYTEGDLDDANFEENKNRALQELAKGNPELLGEGLLFADNLLEVAQNVKAMVRHDRGVRDILEAADIDVGHVKTGVRTEAHFDRTDRVIEKIQDSKFGALFNEATVITAVSAVAAASRITVQKGVARAAALTGVGGAGAGLIAGLRERKRIKEERRQHSREMAMGMEVADIGKRRGELEQTRYETRSAVELTESLQNLFEASDDPGLRKLKDLSEADFVEAAQLLAEVRLRTRMSDERSIDLLHFSDASMVADERLQLALTTIYAERALGQMLEEKGGIAWLESAGISVPVEGDASFNDLLSQETQDIEDALIENMSEKDAVFRKVQRNHVAKAALTAATIGVVAGVATQELLAHAPLIGDHLYGIGEGKPAGGGRSTLLGGLFEKQSGADFSGNLTDVGGHSKFADVEGFTTHQNSDGTWFVEQTEGGRQIALHYDGNGAMTEETQQALKEAGFSIHDSLMAPKLSGEVHEAQLGSNKVVLPKEYAMQEIEPGRWSIVDAKGVQIQEVVLNLDGTFSAETVAELQAGGIGVNQTSEIISSMQQVDGLSHNDVLANHANEVKDIHRVLWYGNDTPAPNFDLNELRVHAGGDAGSWFDEQGNVILDVSAMKENWSFQGGQGVNPFEATAEGRLSLAVSLSRDTQNTVFDFSFQTLPDGRTVATIPPGSAAHQLFQMDGSSRSFNGGYFEVIEHTGQQSSTGENVKVLATYGGENNPGLMTDTVAGPVYANTTILDIVPPPENVQVITYDSSGLVEAAPVIPIRSRRGLEMPKTVEEIGLTNPNLVSSGYFGRSLQELQEWIAEEPERLRTRRLERTPEGEDIWVEADGTPVERDVDRERTALKTYLEKERERNPDHMAMVDRVVEALPPMHSRNRVSVNVPAWMEGASLERFLEQYTAQVDAAGDALSPELYEVNILVNRKAGTPPDNSVEVIQQFVANFQQTHGFPPPVTYYDVELDPPYNNVGYARKLLTDAVIARSAQRDTQEASLYIETEDADLLNVDPKTVINAVTKFDSNPQLDAVRGVQDRAPEYLKENDMLFLRRRAGDFFEIMARDKKFRDPKQPTWDFTWNRVVTGGWNTAYSAEAYALIEGYDSVVAGEDMSIGERITMVRGDGTVPNLEVIGKVATRADSSPRRFIQEMIDDQPAYNDFGNEETNETIRERSIEESLEVIKGFDRITDENKEDFAKSISWYMAMAKSMTSSEAERQQFVRRFMFFLGFREGDYVIEDDRVDITSIDNVRTALEQYRERRGAN